MTVINNILFSMVVSPSYIATHGALVFPVGYGVREGEVPKKNKTGTLQEQITFNEVRRGSSEISELLH